MSKVFDCCMAFNEIEMLLLRFNILAPVVDHFVVVEAGMTHSGQPKPQIIGEALTNDPRFAPFADKIIYSYAPTLEGGNSWERERNHRGLISSALTYFAEQDDWVIVGDADEIANPDVVKVLRDHPELLVVKLELDFYYYDFQHRVQQGWAIGACKWGVEQNANNIRTCTFNSSRTPFPQDHSPSHTRGGWHFSYFGDAQAIMRKVQAFMHHDWVDHYHLTPEKVQRALDAGSDLWGRDLKIERVPVSDTLPRYVLEHRADYEALGWLEREAVAT